MNCQEFQEVLPHIIESGGSPEEDAHLTSCQACSDLVRDLRYIAEQAKLLLPMRDPNPRVWNKIEESLQREGLIQEGRMSRQGHIMKTQPPQKKSWTPLGIMIALATVALLGALLLNYRPRGASGSAEASNAPTSPASSSFDDDDQNLISRLSKQDPDVGQAYKDSLSNVNAYIADARRAVNDDPGDLAAQQHLASAYQQKAMLYHMATARSLP